MSRIAIHDWSDASDAERASWLGRPRLDSRQDIVAQAASVIAAVRTEGDAALRRFTSQFDGVHLQSLRVDAEEIAAAEAELPTSAIEAIRIAIENVRKFHAEQLPAPLRIETMPGVTCERVLRAIPAVGLYVPAGSAPLPSAVIMLAVPATLAGCPQRVLCTPPMKDGRANAAVVVAAGLCGIDTIFKVGGAQAIAAMAYGTESIPKVDKVFGPGNAWVTAAKQLVASDADGAALDMPAGPSEVLVIADEHARADFVAADLLAQAEHDPRSQAILITTSKALAERVANEVADQMAQLDRLGILEQSMGASRIIVVPDLEVAMQLSNDYAPEHLIIQTSKPRALLDDVSNAGSVFLGEWSPEPLGDYCSGTNHVLPTYGYARAYSGLSVLDFVKRMTVQELTPSGLRKLGPVAVALAELEGLSAHAAAVNVRLSALRSESP